MKQIWPNSFGVVLSGIPCEYRYGKRCPKMYLLSSDSTWLLRYAMCSKTAPFWAQNSNAHKSAVCLHISFSYISKWLSVQGEQKMLTKIFTKFVYFLFIIFVYILCFLLRKGLPVIQILFLRTSMCSSVQNTSFGYRFGVWGFKTVASRAIWKSKIRKNSINLTAPSGDQLM